MQAAGAVLGIAGGVMSAAGERSAINKAEKENRARALMDQAKQEQLHREMRGDKGFSLMPLYATAGGKPFEPKAFQDALAYYNYFNQGPSAVESEYKAIIDRYKPIQDTVISLVRDGIYGGGLKSEEMGALAPVEAARTEGALARRSSFTDAVNRQLARIRAMNERRGYGGDSYAKNLLEMEARRRGSEAVATDRAGVNLQNAMDRARLVGGDINRRMGSMSTPGALLGTDAAWNEMPRNVAGSRWQNAFATVQPFQIGTSQPGLIQQPFVQPKANNLMIGGAALSSIGGAMGGGMFTNMFKPSPAAPEMPTNTFSPAVFRGAGSLTPAPESWSTYSPWLVGGSGLSYKGF